VTTEDEESYSGESSFRYVDKLIKEGSRGLMIISPYISDYYITMLVREAGKKRIRVITSESSLGYKDAKIKNFVRKGLGSYFKAILFFIFLDFISIFLKSNYTTIALSAIVAGLIIILILVYKKQRKAYSNIEVKVSKKKFVHEKLYINDGMAIVGSANLTYNGMHKNVEHIEIIRNVRRVLLLKDHFESLWKER